MSETPAAAVQKGDFKNDKRRLPCGPERLTRTAEGLSSGPLGFSTKCNPVSAQNTCVFCILGNKTGKQCFYLTAIFVCVKPKILILDPFFAETRINTGLKFFYIVKIFLREAAA